MRNAPIPKPHASLSNTKGLEKIGKAKTGADMRQAFSF
uniref:Uncharacterized protein n=1 Tax=Arundo donax TaxID=35708 RepID=A0A0A9B2S5_ARUDO